MAPPQLQDKPTKWIDRSVLGRWLRLMVSKGSLKAKSQYLGDWASYEKQLSTRALPDALAGKSDAEAADRCRFPAVKFKPYLTEKYESSGTARGQYFHQDLYVARKIFEANPEKHLDIGSRIDGFIAHVASFRQIEVGDIRENNSRIDGVSFTVVDITDPKRVPEAYCDSLSCLHTIEHIGLGRYGDSIDPHGHVTAIQNLLAIVKPGGTFYLSTPIGPQRLEFNGKRAFDPGTVPYLVEQFRPSMRLVDFAHVDDQGDLHKGLGPDGGLPEACRRCFYGLGIYTFRDGV